MEGRSARLAGMHSHWRQFARALRQFLYGMTVYEMVRHVEGETALREQLFAVATLAGALGLPLPSHYYGLRLLPYALPRLERWRQALWREHDLTELCE